MLARPQRIDRDRRLVLIILTPVDEHFSGAKRLLHIGNDHLRMIVLQQLRQSARKRLRRVIGRRRVQRNVNLQPFRT